MIKAQQASRSRVPHSESGVLDVDMDATLCIAALV